MTLAPSDGLDRRGRCCAGRARCSPERAPKAASSRGAPPPGARGRRHRQLGARARAGAGGCESGALPALQAARLPPEDAGLLGRRPSLRQRLVSHCPSSPRSEAGAARLVSSRADGSVWVVLRISVHSSRVICPELEFGLGGRVPSTLLLQLGREKAGTMEAYQQHMTESGWQRRVRSLAER
jgi:hypothetical protein